MFSDEKYKGLQRKYGVSNEILGVFNENMGVSDEKYWELQRKYGGLQRNSGCLQRDVQGVSNGAPMMMIYSQTQAEADISMNEEVNYTEWNEIKNILENFAFKIKKCTLGWKF